MKNYHTHTYRCKHAVGTVDDYVQAAIKQNVEVLGMSEHTPFPGDSHWLEVRMAYEELEDYCKEIDEAKEKYSNIQILKGFECEYLKEYDQYYKEVLLGEQGADYLILAGHQIRGTSPWNLRGETKSLKEELRLYANYLVKGMETGLFTFIAHPDVFGTFYLEWDEEAAAASKYIIEAAKAYDMPLEVNGYGLRKPEIVTAQGIRRMYPLHKFWEMAGHYDIQVLANSDAHKPEDIIANIEEGYSLAEYYGLHRKFEIKGLR